MNDAAQDEMGVRGTGGSNLRYATNNLFGWFGSGILDKPIGDFYFVFPSDISAEPRSDRAFSPYFLPNRWNVRMNIYSRVIPEPEEYALVFGIFALGFVIFMKYKVLEMAKDNLNRPNWPGAFQNVLIAAMQKGWTLAILLCGFGLAIWLSTPDEQVMYKSEIKRLCAERDKSQKRLGIEIESSDE